MPNITIMHIINIFFILNRLLLIPRVLRDLIRHPRQQHTFSLLSLLSHNAPPFFYSGKNRSSRAAHVMNYFESAVRLNYNGEPCGSLRSDPEDRILRKPKTDSAINPPPTKR